MSEAGAPASATRQHPWDCALHDEHAHETGSERRVLWVVGITLVTMVVELITGYLTRSLALVADGWHMASHAGALGLAAAAYWLARSRASHRAFVFGTGKVYALAAYSNGIALGLVALLMMVEAITRLRTPETIRFAEALPVAVIGLLVNLVSVQLLRHKTGGHAHGHAHAHDHGGAEAHGHRDQNIRGAYLHVLADAMTSVLAIVGLVLGMKFGWTFVDSGVGFLGGVVIGVWSVGLCRGAARQLLDLATGHMVEEQIREILCAIDDVRISDLHVWEIGPGRHGCVVTIVSANPREASDYRDRLLSRVPLSHLTIEIHRQ